MGNTIYTTGNKTSKKIFPRISCQFTGDEQAFITIFNFTSLNEFSLYIRGNDPNKTIEEIIWLNHDLISTDLTEYIKLNINRIIVAELSNEKMKRDTQIILGSNIGYPDTIFMIDDQESLLVTIKKLLQYMTQIEVKSDINW